MESLVDSLARQIVRRDFLRNILSSKKRSHHDAIKLGAELLDVENKIEEMADLLGLVQGKEVNMQDFAKLRILGEQKVRQIVTPPPPVMTPPPVATPPRPSIRDEHVLRLGVDFKYFCADTIEIPYRPGMNKDYPDGGYGKFIFTSAQDKLWAVIAHVLFRLHKPLRLIILKSRQLGCTTFLLALWVWLCLTNDHFVVMFIIDKDEHGTTKREMVIGWLDKISRKYDFFPTLVKREGKILFLSNGSKIIFESAQSPNPGTSEMLRGLHRSESPKWPAHRAQQVEESVTPGLPASKMTLDIDESTAMGIDEFQKKWRRAKTAKPVDGDQLTLIPVFLPWYTSEEYQTEPSATCFDSRGAFKYLNEDDELKDSDVDAEGNDIMLTEEQYARKHNLSPSQLVWRRNKIKVTFKGNRSSFDQEYPTTDEHAWRSSQASFFSTGLLDRVEKQWVRPPLGIFRIKDTKGHMDHTRPVSWLDVEPALVPDRAGELKVWELPVPGETYFLGADFAEGKTITSEQGEQDPDWTRYRIKNSYGRTVAGYSSREKPEEAWLSLLLVAVFYNNAWVNGERNSVGNTVLSFFRLTGYNFQVVHHRPADRPIDERTWTQVTTSNRRDMLYQLRASFSADPSRICDEDLLTEMQSFINKMVGGKPHPEAASGHHDDIIFAETHAEFARFWKYGADRMHQEVAVPKPFDDTPLTAGFRLEDCDLEMDDPW